MGSKRAESGTNPCLSESNAEPLSARDVRPNDVKLQVMRRS